MLKHYTLVHDFSKYYRNFVNEYTLLFRHWYDFV